MKSLRKSLVAILMVAMLLITSFPVMAAPILEGAGSITVNKPTDPAVTLKGRDLKAYQLFSAKFAGTDKGSYFLSDDQFAVVKEITGVDGLTINPTGTKEEAIKAISDWLTDNARTSADLEKFSRAVLDANKTAGGKLPVGSLEVNGAGDKASLNNIELGYYLVADETTNFTGDLQNDTKAIVALSNTNPHREVNLKADVVTIGKKINNATQNDKSNPQDKLDNDNHSIGENIDYELTSKVPDMKGYESFYFIFKDTLSKGLAYQDDSLVIKVGNKTLVKDTDYTLEKDGDAKNGTNLKIIFKNFIQYADQAGAAITATYTAKITEDVEVGKTGNPNKVKLIFQRDPDEDTKGKPDNPDNPTGETPEQEVRTYTTELKLHKTDNAGQPLAGAEFKLTGDRIKTVLTTGQAYLKSTEVKEGYVQADANTYYKLKTGQYTTEAPTTDNQEDYESQDTYKLYNFTNVKEENAGTTGVTLTTGPDGNLTFTGLGAGIYKLEEITAPAGYTAAKPIYIKISWTAPVEGQTDCTWTYEKSDKANGPWETLGDNNSNMVTVENTPGTLLPETGGIGTTIFYALGSLIAVIALVVLVSRKRVQASHR